MTQQILPHHALAQHLADAEPYSAWVEQTFALPYGRAAPAGQANLSTTLLCLRDRLRAQLDELAAELDELAAAVAHERREQELGLPSLALATLQAHLYGAQSALLALHSVLIQIEALCVRIGPRAPNASHMEAPSP